MTEPPPEDEMAEPPPEDEVDPPPEDEVVKVRMMLNAQKASPKKNPKYSDEEIMEANELRLMKLASRGNCHNEAEGKCLFCYQEQIIVLDFSRI